MMPGLSDATLWSRSAPCLVHTVILGVGRAWPARACGPVESVCWLMPHSHGVLSALVRCDVLRLPDFPPSVQASVLFVPDFTSAREPVETAHPSI